MWTDYLMGLAFVAAVLLFMALSWTLLYKFILRQIPIFKELVEGNSSSSSSSGGSKVRRAKVTKDQ